MFSAPIPGQSLTSEPKNSPWENPAQFADPEEALLFHMERLGKPDKIKSSLGLLELGLDVVTLTEGILRSAVIEGRHSVDVSLIIGPILHEYIVGNADIAGIDYEEGLDKGLDDTKFNYDIAESKSRKILDQIEDGEGELDLDPEVKDEPVQEEMQPEVIEEKPAGLMARRV